MDKTIIFLLSLYNQSINPILLIITKEEIEQIKPIIKKILKYCDDEYGEDSYQALYTLRMFELLHEIKENLK